MIIGIVVLFGVQALLGVGMTQYVTLQELAAKIILTLVLYIGTRLKASPMIGKPGDYFSASGLCRER